MVKKKVTLSLEENVYNNFQKYCNANAIMLSRKIEIWIEDFLNENKQYKLEEKEKGVKR